MKPGSPMEIMTFGHEWIAVIIVMGTFSISWTTMNVVHEWCMQRGIKSDGCGFVGAMAGAGFMLFCLALSLVVHLVKRVVA